jgi:hypothetical protein
LLLADAVFFRLIRLLMPLMAPSRRLMASKISEVLKIWLAEKLGQWVGDFFVGSMVFAIDGQWGKNVFWGLSQVAFV